MAKRPPSPAFSASRAAERRFATQLRQVSRHVGDIVRAHADGPRIVDQSALNRAMQVYSRMLEPWAETVVAGMIKSVSADNLRSWRRSSRLIGRELRDFLMASSSGDLIRQMQHERVGLITSLPLEAAQRAQELALEAVLDSSRASKVAQQINSLGEITQSRAVLIARTEAAAVNSLFTQTRSQSAGIEEYYWRTMEDESVRPAHREMADRIFRFDDPPEVRGEGRHGPGQIYNCRCFAEPIIPVNPDS